MKDAPANLWFGRTAHIRSQPFKRSFTQKIAMLEVDIDRLDEAAALSPLFSVDKFNLISFTTRDHGPRTGGSLRPWADEMFRDAGLDLTGGTIRLVSFPRVMGYRFAPLSLWYGYDHQGALSGIIYEVNNTFGETHSYVANCVTDQLQHSAPKTFHVSPFFDVTGRYLFKLRNPTENLRLIVENKSKDDVHHTASIVARKSVLTTAALSWFASRPYAALGVTIGIHWQALCLWWQGAKYHSRPPLPAHKQTLARPISLKETAL